MPQPRSTTARRAVLFLVAVGLTGCVLVDRLALLPALGFLALGWAYSAGPTLKSSPVGFAVVIGAGAGLTYLAGWTIAPDDGRELLVGGALSLWVGMTCAAEDFSDVEGDRSAGRRSWPVLLGPGRAGQLVAVAALLASLIVLALGAVVPDLRTAALVVLAGSAALTFQLLRTPPAAAPRSRLRRPYRVFLATQFAANLAIVSGLLAHALT